MNQPRILLASTSRYRRALLERLGLAFGIDAPEIDETPGKGEPPGTLALRLAEAKARAAAARWPGALVIGSDQVAELDGRILGKPGSNERAREQLLAASGHEVLFHTAVALVDARREPLRAELAVDLTRVRFRKLGETEVDRYLAREDVLDCAGSFKAEGLGITLFESIRNKDPSALIGLPLIALARLLRAAGVALP